MAGARRGGGRRSLALRLRGRLSVPAFAGLAVALVALDLLKAGAGYNPAIEQRCAEQPATPAIEYLQARRPERFAGLAGTAPRHVVAARCLPTPRCATASSTRAAT